MFDLQALVDGMGAQEQRKRAETQLTLGGLIDVLEKMPPDMLVANLRDLDSYRGYYHDLYFCRGEGTRRAAELLAECKAAMGQVFTGYKGGDYVMGALTPLWISEYGHSSGTKLMSLNAGGEIETEQEED